MFSKYQNIINSKIPAFVYMLQNDTEQTYPKQKHNDDDDNHKNNNNKSND